MVHVSYLPVTSCTASGGLKCKGYAVSITICHFHILLSSVLLQALVALSKVVDLLKDGAMHTSSGATHLSSKNKVSEPLHVCIEQTH